MKSVLIGVTVGAPRAEARRPQLAAWDDYGDNQMWASNAVSFSISN